MRLSFVALFVLGLLCMAVPATASRTASEASLTIRLISTPGREVLRDLPPKGLKRGIFSKGDSFTGTSILRNASAQFGKPKGAVVGTDTYNITITTPPVALFKVQVKLPGGTLRIYGRDSLKSPSPIAVPVVSGTGAFAGARGTALASGLSGGRELNVYRLRLP
jgi:hypothetical protein